MDGNDGQAGGCPVAHGGQKIVVKRSNRDWWPNQLNPLSIGLDTPAF